MDLQLECILDPFYTTEQLATVKGAGMWVVMVHGIMHEHSGHIVVKTAAGKGATFLLLLPVIDIQIDTIKQGRQ